MKQTKNALSMLLNAYRSVFKSAYFKGMASAVVLTAGLAAGAANATTVSGASQLTDDENPIVVGDGEHFDVVVSGADNVWDANVTISNDTTATWQRLLGSGSGSITGNGSLTINSSQLSGGDSNSSGSFIFSVSGSDSSLSVDINAITVENGSVVSLMASNPDGNNSGAVTVSANTIDVIGEGSELRILANGGAGQQVTLGNSGDTITVKDGAKLLSSGDASNDSGAIINAVAFNLSNEAEFGVQKDTTLNVYGDSKWESSELNVASGSTLTITAHDPDDNGEKSASDVTIEVQGGTADISGNLQLNSGKLSLAQDVVLTRSTTSDENGVGITVSGAAANTQEATLVLSGKQLTDYLTTKINSASNTDSNTDGRGAILIANANSSIEFSDAVDLYELTSGDNAIVINSGSSLTSGALSVSGGGIIKGADLTVSNSGDNLNLGQAVLVAEALTLGSEEFDSATNDIAFSGAEVSDRLVLNSSGDTFYLKHNIDLDRQFSDVAGQIVSETGNNISIGSGSTSAVLNVNGGAWESAENITIVSGGINVEVCKSGSSSSQAGYDVENDGNPVSLTLTGGLNFNHEDTPANAYLKVAGKSGANATVNLERADVTWGSGSIVVSGQKAGVQIEGQDEPVELGEGILQITGNQLTQFLADSSQTTLSVSGDGRVQVANSNTGEYTFDDFVSGGASLTAAQVSFTGAGVVEFDGNLKLSAKSGDGNASALDIGAGTIEAQTITLSDENTTTASDVTVPVDDVEVVRGNLIVHQGLRSENDQTIVFGGTNISGATSLTLDGAGSVTADLQFIGNGTSTNTSTLDVDAGSWTVQNVEFGQSGSFTVGGAEGEAAASLTGSDLLVAANAADSSINETGSVEFDTAVVAGTINVSGKLTIYGLTGLQDTDSDAAGYNANADTNGVNLSGSNINVTGAQASFALGEAATAGVFEIDEAAGTVTSTVWGTVNVDENANLDLAFDSDVTFTKDMIDSLTTTLGGASAISGGVVNMGYADIGVTFNDDGTEAVWGDNVEKFANYAANYTTNDLKQVTVTEISSSDVIKGHYGALRVDSNFNEGSAIQLNGTLGLYDADDGYYAYKGYADGSKQELAVNNSDQGDLILGGNGGKIGSVTLNDGDLITIGEGLVTIAGSVSLAGDDAGLEAYTDTTVEKDFSGDYLGAVAADLTIGGNATVDKQLEVGSQGSVSVANGTLTIGEGDVVGSVEAKDIKLTQDAAEDDADGTLRIYGGTVKAETLTVTEPGAGGIFVGYEAEEGAVDDADTIYDETVNYSGNLEITKELSLNGAYLSVDPLYGAQTALISVNKFAGDSAATSADADLTDFNGGVVDGKVFVGANSALGIGTESLDALQEVVSNFQSNGSLVKSNVGSLTFVNKAITVSGGMGLVMTAEILADFKESLAAGGSLADQKVLVTSGEVPSIADGIYFGENTALVLGGNVVEGIVQSADAYDAAVHFEGQDAKLVAAGGEIMLGGTVRAGKTYNLFSDAGNVGAPDQTGVNVVDLNGVTIADTEENQGKGITVTTMNGAIIGELLGDNVTGVDMDFAPNVRQAYAGASDPVFQTLMAYGYGNVEGVNPNKLEEGQEVTELYNGYTEESIKAHNADATQPLVKNTNYENALIEQAMTMSNGAPVETAARLAVYGGAVQAAMAANASSYEAIATRMGMGNQNSVLTYANNADGAGIWLAPVYKNHDSDGFDAQGVDYGVDMDLYGVALGADFTFAQHFRAGAMFNVGSGDADGKGAGSAVSNDFDYWGASIYGGFAYENFSITADIGYTSVDNDIDASTGLSDVTKLSASTDTEAWTVGLTAQYKFELSALDITPHVGARFTRIDMDDYSVGSNLGTVAEFDADSMNVFSIPVGVTFSKDITAGDWSVMPSLDLTVTANTGDDELDGDVSWSGISNLNTATSTEVLDDFTYGANLGISATNGAFSFGLGVNYVGSDNADEFGVQANARFTF